MTKPNWLSPLQLFCRSSREIRYPARERSMLGGGRGLKPVATILWSHGPIHATLTPGLYFCAHRWPLHCRFGLSLEIITPGIKYRAARLDDAHRHFTDLTLQNRKQSLTASLEIGLLIPTACCYKTIQDSDIVFHFGTYEAKTFLILFSYKDLGPYSGISPILPCRPWHQVPSVLSPTRKRTLTSSICHQAKADLVWAARTTVVEAPVPLTQGTVSLIQPFTPFQG